jgi:hypothetical protein
MTASIAATLLCHGVALPCYPTPRAYRLKAGNPDLHCINLLRGNHTRNRAVAWLHECSRTHRGADVAN